QNISPLLYVENNHHFIQYKVDLTTPGSVLPRLHDITINTISYNTDTWYQTDDSTGNTGFNLVGSSLTNTTVSGSGEPASVFLIGVLGSGEDGDFNAETYDGVSIAGITGTPPNFTIDTDEVTHGGVFSFASFQIPAGQVVRTKGSNPLILNVLGEVTIDGTLNAKGFDGDAGGAGGPGGGTGGSGCTTGSGLGGGGGIADGDKSGAGGAGFASAGISGQQSFQTAVGVGGAVYGDSSLSTLYAGSGGGGAAAIAGGCVQGAHGGGGGGLVQINAGGAITVGILGLISSDGGVGGNKPQLAVVAGGGAGGGSAGAIILKANDVLLNNPGASLSVRGGAGGASKYFAAGGAGGDGRVVIEANNLTGAGSINVGLGSVYTKALSGGTAVSGSYISAIYDVGMPAVWESVNWIEMLPPGTSINVLARSCVTANCSDRGINDWSVASNGQDISSLAFVSDGHRYAQYKVDFNSTNGIAVPAIESVAINMILTPPTTFISSAFDTMDSANQISGLNWVATTPVGTSVNIQLRTSPDGANWGPWYGPTSTSDYYTVSGTTINAVHSDGVSDRYIQYLVDLQASSSGISPVLNDVTISYITFGSGSGVGSGSFRVLSGGGNSSQAGSGGGSLAIYMTSVLLIVFLVRRSDGRYGKYIGNGCILISIGAALPDNTTAAVLNFSASNPDPSANYTFFTVGNATSNFYQEFYIEKDPFITYQSGVHTASGARGNAGKTNFQNSNPLSNLSSTGSASGNPSKVIIYQKVTDGEMLADFLKDKFDKKPRILHTIVKPDMLYEFESDMRASNYADMNTISPMTNHLKIDDTTGSLPNGIDWSIATDAPAANITAGRYIYTNGSGPKGSEGTYTYFEGSSNEKATDWESFFDTGAGNVWTKPGNMPQ
ncbi:MAG: hypothetical protein ACE5EH_09640, partial [Gammaproteobacteria bacterium]